MRSRGFTLVEVMVALAIVAVALPAVLMSLYQQIDDTGYLRDKTMAQMVAANKLAEMRLVIASTRVLTAGKANGVAPMADRDWHWWTETKPTEAEKFLRIEIKVALAEDQQEQPLYTLTAFMSSDLKVDTSDQPEIPQDPPNPPDPSQPSVPDSNITPPPDLPPDLPLDIPTDGT